MALSLKLLGANYKVAPIEIREKLAIPKSKLPDALKELRESKGVEEAFILSTCNRTEIYVVGDTATATESAKTLLSSIQGIPAEQLNGCLYEKTDSDCVNHIFSVASGLDSMILGEVQILGQIREGFGVALEVGTLGKQLDTLLRKALEAGKKARNETEISANAVSVSYAAVELAKMIFGDISKSVALVIGAGEMGELIARNMQDNGVGNLVFTNRTHSKAMDLANQFRGTAVKFEEIAQHLKTIDIVISSTDAPHAIVHKDMVQSALSARRGRPLFMIDLAVPRDIEPEIHSLEGVYLYNVDDLQAVVASNLKERAREAKKVEELLKLEVDRFMAWRGSLDVSPTIQALRQKAEDIRLAELEKIGTKLDGLNDSQRNAVNAVTLAIINKLLHNPTTVLKSAANNGDGRLYTEAVRDLFGLQKE